MPRHVYVDEDELERLYVSGLSARQVSRRLGVSPDTVKRRMRAKGLIRPKEDARLAAVHARVFSAERRLAVFHSRTIEMPNGCLEWTAARDPNGYGRFWDGESMVLAHRWIYEQVSGRKLSSDECVCHRCDNPPCVRFEHFFIGSVTDNNRDAFAKRRVIQRRDGRFSPGDGPRRHASETCCTRS